MFLIRFFSILVLFIILSGCQQKVYLMPSPVGLHSGNELFAVRDDNIDENLLYTLYATNRLPFGEGSKGGLYTIFPSDTLKLGFVVHRIGEEQMSWNEFYSQSHAVKRKKKLIIDKQYVREVFELSIDEEPKDIPSQAYGFFDQINQELDASIDKDILVYVHGANSSFNRSTAQGAQLYHFAGQNSVIITFCWPSAESLLRYDMDVQHGQQAVPAFSRLLEVLAEHTKARNINILAYSAGARIVAQGLSSLPTIYSSEPVNYLRDRLRIGEVYFAAPDTRFRPFLSRYLIFREIVYRTTINFNTNDTVLSWAAFWDGKSRLGRPDTSELDDDEVILMLEAMKTPYLNVIDVGGSEPLLLGSSHNYWYNHPWVSMDVLLLMLFNADPEERGLIEHWDDGVARVYRFPEGYDMKLESVLQKNQQMLNRKYFNRSRGMQLLKQ